MMSFQALCSKYGFKSAFLDTLRGGCLKKLDVSMRLKSRESYKPKEEKGA